MYSQMQMLIMCMAKQAVTTVADDIGDIQVLTTYRQAVFTLGRILAHRHKQRIGWALISLNTCLWVLVPS